MAWALLKLCTVALRSAINTSAMSANFASATIGSITTGKKLVNGIELFYDSRGSGDHALVCIPGALGTTRSDFTPQLEYFGSRDGIQIVAFDPRGYGYSRPPRRHFSGTSSFENDAEDAKGLMDALGIRKFSVLGWSDGGISGLILASRYSESVRSLVVWGANAYVSKEDIACYNTIKDISKWSAKMREPLEKEYGKDDLHHMWTSWCDVLEGVSNSGGNICKDLLGGIKSPTLILHGMKDPIVPSFHPTYLSENIQNSVVHNFPDGKHNIHLRYPKEFNEIVENFLREV